MIPLRRENTQNELVNWNTIKIVELINVVNINNTFLLITLFIVKYNIEPIILPNDEYKKIDQIDNHLFLNIPLCQLKMKEKYLQTCL